MIPACDKGLATKRMSSGRTPDRRSVMITNTWKQLIKTDSVYSDGNSINISNMRKSDSSDCNQREVE